MSGILRRMDGDVTGYDFLAGKDAGYGRAWNEAVETIRSAFDQRSAKNRRPGPEPYVSGLKGTVSTGGNGSTGTPPPAPA